MNTMSEELRNSILKTGTTILGIVCKDGIIMAADRQVTAGTTIHNKRTIKVFPINDYIVFAGAGNASDIQRFSKLVAAELRIKELRSRSKPTIKEAANLLASIAYSTIRQFSTIPSIVGSLIGGVNEDGFTELYTIDPSGSIIKVEDYDANFGSGMPYVLGYLERNWKEDLNVKEAIELAKEAIKSSTQRDTGSGYGIDIFTVTKDGIKKVVSQEILPEYKDE